MSNIKSNQYILFSERNNRYIRMKMFINPEQVYLYCDVVILVLNFGLAVLYLLYKCRHKNYLFLL